MKKGLLFLLILLCTFGIRMDVFGQRIYAEGQKEALEEFLHYTPPGGNGQANYQRIIEGCTSIADFWDSNDNYITTSPEGYITHLYWGGRMLTGALDVTQLQHLEVLDCSNNYLVELKADNLPKLAGLYCAFNNFTELKLNNLPALTVIRAIGIGLNKLELTDLPMLTELNCLNNNLEELNLSNCTELKTLNCTKNKLRVLNLKNCSKLNTLFCSKNNLEDKTFILPPKASLSKLYCDENDALSDAFLTQLNKRYPEDDINYIYPDFFPIITYHTITLEVGEGIELRGLTPGTLEIEEGGHLYLQFLPEDRSLTADDVILLVDGVETAFRDFGKDFYFSYILNPITEDHSVQIRMRKHPEQEGVGISSTEAILKIYSQDGQLIIETATPQVAQVYNINGTLAAVRTINGREIIRLPQGIYLVNIAGKTEKVIVGN